MIMHKTAGRNHVNAYDFNVLVHNNNNIMRRNHCHNGLSIPKLKKIIMIIRIIKCIIGGKKNNKMIFRT